MQYLTPVLLLLGLASAAPTSPATPLERRACSVAYPSGIGFPINFDIRQDAGKTNVHDGYVHFTTVPEGSYGCQLEANFPAGYPITSSGASQVNVYWDSGAAKGSLFGTVTFASSPVAPTKFVINSAKCERYMGFRLSIAHESLPGRVAFADTKDAGLTISYNC